MPRALLIVLDSVGIGHAPDAAKYGDEGADTLGHIYERVPGLVLPNLDAMGLAGARMRSAGGTPTLLGGAFGWMSESSCGKDTTSGHWEIAGAVLEEPFATYEAFPDAIVAAIEAAAGVTFIGNYPQSGTVILEELGDAHVATGEPILYTSADSVLQIAAHEEVISVERLYGICRIARELCGQIGRVIARPFLGVSGKYERTSNRKDFSLMPPETILNRLPRVIGVGKISDIFAGSGIDESYPTKSNAAGMAKTAELWRELDDGFVFVNLVDFDMLYGHRRDPEGYARALMEFDTWLGGFLPNVRNDDLFMITADHGNDPTWAGTDHTREMVPLLVKGGGYEGCLGGFGSFGQVSVMLERFFLG
jgi:phosphopentomutase